MAYFEGVKTQPKHKSTRHNRRKGTKTKVLSGGSSKKKENKPPKSRNSRAWKVNGVAQRTDKNPRFA